MHFLGGVDLLICEEKCTMVAFAGYALRLQDYAADPNPALMELKNMKKVLDHLIGLDSNPTTISNKNWDPRHSADICICAYHMYIPHDMNNSPAFFFLLVIDQL